MFVPFPFQCTLLIALKEYRVGVPLNGQMMMPGNQNGLMLQYPRFSNEYIDPLFPPSSEYKVSIVCYTNGNVIMAYRVESIVLFSLVFYFH